MTTKKKYLAGLAAALCVGAALPRAAKAVYTTPVTVYNTSSQPVPGVDIEKLARIPYESVAANNNCVNNGTGCQFNFTPPPSGYRLVAENLSGYFQLSPAATVPAVGYLEDNTIFRIRTGFNAPLGPIGAAGTIPAAFNQPTKFYFDPAEGTPTAVVSATWIGAPASMTLTGYLENCSITGCPLVQR